MSELPVIRIEDSGLEIDCPRGDPILFALLDRGINITSICGGNCSCGTCNIEVVAGMEHLPAIHAGEAFILAKIKRKGPGVRLACQAIPSGDVTIHIRPQF
jgi:2Fe-2S ferredoxin